MLFFREHFPQNIRVLPQVGIVLALAVPAIILYAFGAVTAALLVPSQLLTVEEHGGHVGQTPLPLSKQPRIKFVRRSAHFGAVDELLRVVVVDI